MSALNWKDHNTDVSEAHASREVGGRYRIRRWLGGDKTWYGAINETTYLIYYRPTRDCNWHNVFHPRGTPGTLAEAKRMAEEDHEKRRREAATEASSASE
jgi:hypothetical protein